MSAPDRPQVALGDDYEELDFRIIQEGWNEYQLADGSHIRARTLLTRIFRNPNNPENLSFDLIPPIYVVSAPVGLRGPRDNILPGELAQLPSNEVNVNTNNEFWNRYEVFRTNQIVRLRLTVTEIRRVIGRFDEKGMPAYIVNSGPTIAISNRQQNPLP